MNRFKQLQRFFSGVVAVIFLMTNTVIPLPAAHAADIELQKLNALFKIPVEFGKVTSSFQGRSGQPLLVHIQEAHANYDAQKNIRNILELLVRDYGVREIFLEGAGHKLKPELFEFFPKEPDLQQAANEKLMQAGELTGAEAFLMNAAQKAEGWGAEQAETYAKNRQAFARVFKERSVADRFWEDSFQVWKKKASLSLSKRLKDLLLQEVSFDEKKLSLADWLDLLNAEAQRSLTIDLKDVREQGDWPALVRYFRLKTLGSRIDPKALVTEKAAFLKDLKSHAIPETQLQSVKEFLERKDSQNLPSFQTRFLFEKLMDLLPENYSFASYPNLRFVIQQGILLSELQGETLQTEIGALTGKITNRLVKTEQDKRLVSALRHLRLLKKLFRLELTREEYEELKTLGLGTRGSGLDKTSNKSKSLGASPEVRALFATAMGFYEGAIVRENGMMEKTLNLMKEHKQTKAVLITGGFHSEGLKEKALQGGISYVEITPRIGEVPAESNKNYLEALLGKRTVENSQLAILRGASDVLFLQEVNPNGWRRELAAIVARIGDSLRSIRLVSLDRAHKAISGFLQRALSEASTITSAGTPSFARAEVRTDHLETTLESIANGEAEGLRHLLVGDVANLREAARIHLAMLRLAASALNIQRAEKFLETYQGHVDSIQAGGRSEARSSEEVHALTEVLKMIASGTAGGFYFLRKSAGRAALDFKTAAGLALGFLKKEVSPAHWDLATRVVRSFAGYANSFSETLRSEVRANLREELFRFSEDDLRGFEELKVSDFLKAKGIDLNTLKGGKVFLILKESDIEYAVTIDDNPNLVVSLMIDRAIRSGQTLFVRDIRSVRAEKTPSRSEARIREGAQSSWTDIATPEERQRDRAKINEEINRRGAIIYEVNARRWFQEKLHQDPEGKNFWDAITDEDLEMIRAAGKNVLWLMGVWELSDFGRQFNEAWENPESPGRVASAFGLNDYTLNPELGDETSFRHFVIRANRKGLKIALDFIPNHMATDSVWLREHPEWFMQDQRPETLDVLRDSPAISNIKHYLPPAVSGPSGFSDIFLHERKLNLMAAFLIFIGNQVFKIMHGRRALGINPQDIMSHSWIDTAQLNLSHPGVQAKFKEVLSYIMDITNGGGVRVDMAHYTLKEHINQAWLGPLGQRPMEAEFLPGLIAGITSKYPGALFFAEGYEGKEGALQSAGMNLTYDKHLYDVVVEGKGPISEIMDYLTNRARTSLEYLTRTVHFLEHHDDPNKKRIANLMSPEQEMAALAIMSTAAPGALLLYQGQELRHSNGKPTANWLPPAGTEETNDREFFTKHQQLLEFAKDALFRKGEVRRLPGKKADMSDSVVAVQRRLGDSYAMVLVNYSQNMAGIQYVPDMPQWGHTESEAADYEWRDMLTGQRFPLDHDLALKGWEYRILELRKKKALLQVITAPPETEEEASARSPFDRLWEGVGERNPDWQRMNAILEVLLFFLKKNEREIIFAHDIMADVGSLLLDQGLSTGNDRIYSLLNRLAELHLIKRKGDGFEFAQSPRVIAVKADSVSYIRKELEEALHAWTQKRPGAEEALQKVMMDYANAVASWPSYPVESRWPVLRAVALLNSADQEALAQFLNEHEEIFGANELVDAILLMLKAKPLAGWLKKYASHLAGRTIYYFSPETVLLAGGLGRVGQFHTAKIAELIGTDAEIALGEPYYHFRLKADNKTEEPIDYSALPTPVQDLQLLFELDVLVHGRSVKAKVFSGKTADGKKVYLIDGGDYYTRLLYRYGPENGWAHYSEFVEFFSRATVELADRLEKTQQEQKADEYRAPILWFNDGQMGPAALYKIMADRAGSVLRNALTWFATHTYRNRGWVDFFKMGFIALVWTRLFGDHGEHDSSSAGVRGADGVNAVSAVHRDEVAPLDPFASVVALTNGDDREISSAVFRGIAQELFPGTNVEFLTLEQIISIKREAKQRLSDEYGWGLDPDGIVISYSGRLVWEKAGRSRAFTNANLRELIKAGAQVLIFGNVQKDTQRMYDDLQKLAEEINQVGPGKLIVVTGWDIEDQRKLLAATDLQVQDSDRDLLRGTGAAEYTEADISANAGLQMGPPWLEGIIQKQGVVLNRQRPGSGNTIIPNSNNRTNSPEKDEPDAYLEAFQWAIETFKTDRLHFASYQATSLRLSRALEAVLTSAEYLRQFDRAVQKKDNLRILTGEIRTLWNQPQGMEALKSIFDQLTSMTAREAAAFFGQEKLPAVMAVVAALFPSLLEKIQAWDPEEYEVLSAAVFDPALKDLFESGKIQIHSMHNRDDNTLHEESLVVSRTLGERNVIIPVHLGRNVYGHENGKVWLFMREMESVITDPDAAYQVSDWSLEKGKKVTYPAQRNAAYFLHEWLGGIPVRDQARDDSGFKQRGKGYQILTIEKASDAARSEARSDASAVRVMQRGWISFSAEAAKSIQRARSEIRAEGAWPQHEPQKIAVIGTGFVGATKAILLVTDWGHDVVAVDIQPAIVQKLSSGKLTFHADDLQELLSEGLGTGRLKFTTDYREALEGREIIFLAVQTPQSDTGHANINYLKDSVREIARLIHPGESKIIIGKSTAPPRDTVAALKEVVAEEFRRREEAGEDLQGAKIHFAWEPEFLREGKEVEDDRGVAGRVVIGADDPAIALKIKQLYDHANPAPDHVRTEVPIVLTDLISAPLVKYAANGYRGMKISFINFISWLTEYMHLDIDQVAHDIATQPDSGEEDRRVGRAFLMAGLGFGGSCFPKDLAAAVQISRGLGVLPGLVLDALAVNELQWKRFVERLVIPQLQNVQGKTIAILGASFKPGTDDIREARAIKVIATLLGRGAKIRVYDPVAVERLRDPRIGPFKDDTAIEYYSDPSDLEKMLEGADAVILATEWPDFLQINFDHLRHWFLDRRKPLPPIFDGRNFLDKDKVNDPATIQRLASNGASGQSVKSLEFPYFNIGHGETSGSPAVPHDQFVARIKESFLALRISYINMIAEIAERLGANIRDVKRGLGLDFVVGEEYLAPGIGWGGNKLSKALEDWERYVRQHLPAGLLRQFHQIRQAIQQKFLFPPDPDLAQEISIPFITTVKQINDRQIELYIEKAKKVAGGDLRGKVVAVLGLAYKPGEFTTYRSRALMLIEALLKEGAIVRATDVDQQAVTNARRELEEMHVPSFENITFVLGARTAQENAREAVRGSDLQMLVTASSAFADVRPIFFDDKGHPVAKASRVVDGRHFYDPRELAQHGIEYFAVGIPSQMRTSQKSVDERAVEKLKSMISFPEQDVEVHPLEDGCIRANLKVVAKEEARRKSRLFVHFGFYGHEGLWQDQAVNPRNEIKILGQNGEWVEYEVSVVIDPRKAFPDRSGRLGITFFALPKSASPEDAGFFTQRLWAGNASVRDGKFEVEAGPKRSELRATQPTNLARDQALVGAEAKDRVRVVELHAQDIDQVLGNLKEAIVNAHQGQQPVLLQGISMLPDEDELFAMLGFVPSRSRKAAEQEALNRMVQAIEQNAGTRFDRRGNRLTVMAGGGTWELHLTNGQYSRTFNEFIGNLYKNGADRQKGIASFKTEALNKRTMALQDPVPVIHGLSDLEALAQEIGLDPGMLQDVVITQAQYDALETSQPADKKPAGTASPRAADKSVASETAMLVRTLTGMQEIWERHRSHWAVQRVAEESAAVANWDEMFRTSNARIRQQSKQTVLGLRARQRVSSREAGLMEANAKTWSYFDETPYSRVLEARASLEKLLNQRVEGNPQALKSHLRRIFNAVIQLQTLVRKRTLSFRKIVAVYPHPEILYFFAQDIVLLRLVQDTTTLFGGSGSRGLMDFAMETLGAQPKLSVVHKVAPSAQPIDYDKLREDLAALKEMNDGRQAFYNAQSPILAETAGRMYGDVSQEIQETLEIKDKEDFTEHLRRVLDVLGTLWSSDIDELWFFGTSQIPMSFETMERYRDIIDRLMRPLFLDSREQVDLFAFGRKNPLLNGRSELRAQPSLGDLSKDQVRVKELYAQDIDQVLGELKEAIVNAHQGQQPVLLQGISTSPDHDELFAMLGFVPVVSRKIVEERTLGRIVEAITKDATARFDRKGSRLTVKAGGETWELVLTNGQYSENFDRFVGNQYKTGEARQKGLAGFRTEVLDKQTVALKDPVRVIHEPSNLEAFAREIGLEIQKVRDVVVTQAQYRKLADPGKPLAKAKIRSSGVIVGAVPEKRTMLSQTVSPEVVLLQGILKEIQDLWKARQAHWAVQQVHQEKGALRGWDEIFRIANLQRQAMTTASFDRLSAAAATAGMMLPDSVQATVRGTAEASDFDSIPYEDILKTETQIGKMLNQALKAKLSPEELRARIQQIFFALVRVQGMVRNRTRSFQRVTNAGTFPELLSFFAKDIISLDFLQQITHVIFRSKDRSLVAVALEALDHEPGLSAVQPRSARGVEGGVRSPRSSRGEIENAILELGRLLHERGAFYQRLKSSPFLARTIGKLYEDVSSRFNRLSSIEDPSEFTFQLGCVLNLLVDLWVSDERGLWAEETGQTPVSNELRQRYQEVMHRIMCPLFFSTPEAVDHYIFGGEGSVPPQRSETRAIPAVAMTALGQEQWARVLAINERLGGGKLQGFRKVTTDLTDGIWSLVAHTLHAANLMASFFDGTAARDAQGLDGSVLAEPRTALEKARLATARRMLGLPAMISAGDGFIIRPGLAFKDGALFVKNMVFGNAPVVIYDPKGEITVAEKALLQQINARLDRAQLPQVQVVEDLNEAAELLKSAFKIHNGVVPPLHLKVMANVLDPLALLLKQQYGDNVLLVTSQRFKAFLELAGVASLVNRLQNEYLATGRSA